MVPARKHPTFNYAVRRWLTLVLRRRFHQIRIKGAEHLLTLVENQSAPSPVVGCVNHTNWWDGFVLYILSHRLVPHDIYLAMEEKNLLRYRFFTWMGVFGVDLRNERSALPGLRYAVRLLRGISPGAESGKQAETSPKLIWMFVQGALLSPRIPISVKAGAPFLARQVGAVMLPLILRYEWLEESLPSIFVRVGPALPPATSAEALEICLNDLARQSDAEIDRRDFTGWEELLAPRMSINKQWDYLMHLLLGKRGAFQRENG